MNILISPWSRPLRNNKRHSKNYPWWEEFCLLLKSDNHYLTQIGAENEKRIINVNDYFLGKNIDLLKNKIIESDFWISVDNFINHYGTILGKRGMVIWSKSDPNIFGYSSNINVLKDRKYLRKDQFGIWENISFEKEAFYPPEKLFNIFKES